ncbi:hypothetical protein LX99_05023 [Mucilaginibacter oryzae]|uniref:Uncharacterized protein n=1 Tax=Mucilaginibacter oryzae TaxID=468058 RepID=A0A316GTL6_9SPHI|nr:hypothetical protein [Mucilaginibacter oryzae]PWK65378.1 hypothetical protein LX99_05023 [Mucilaginibacter oryzae]
MRTRVTALKAGVEIRHTHQGNETLPLQDTTIKQANRSISKLAYLANKLFYVSRLGVRK